MFRKANINADEEINVSEIPILQGLLYEAISSTHFLDGM
jgi:hypothetical protein